MSTRDQQDALQGQGTLPSAKNMRIGIVVSRWNSEITQALCDAAVDTLLEHGARRKNIPLKYVPGSFELTMGAHLMALYGKVEAVICLGCVIQGETPHFTYICQSITLGITELNMKHGIPFIFGVLTTHNFVQAKERAGGKLGNKGREAAIAAIQMVDLKRQMSRAT